MWKVDHQELSSSTDKFVFPGTTREDVLKAWEEDENFRTFFTSLIAKSRFNGLAWETPVLKNTNLQKPFEFVLVNSPALATAGVDSGPFSKHFKSQSQSESVLLFPNLGGDALMVVPRQVGPPKIYGHLVRFLREAPEEQVHRFWQQTSKAVSKRLALGPVWLSTAGLGVKWLHGRVCSTPKYYRYGAYVRV